MVIVFPYGVCAICEGGLPRASRNGRPRAICDSADCKSATSAYGARLQKVKRQRALASAPPVQPPTAKCCPRCGETKTLEEFPRHRGRPDGRYSYCKPCSAARTKAQREAHPERAAEIAHRRYEREMSDPERRARRREVSRESARRFRERHPDRKREQWQRWFDKNIRSDPKRHAEWLDGISIDRRARRLEDGLPIRPNAGGPMKHRSLRTRETLPRLDPEPFRTYLRGWIAKLGNSGVAARVGVDESRVRQAMTEGAAVSVVTVEEWVARLDSDRLSLADIYPELYS